MTRRLVRWNPVREMINLRDEVDRLWDQSASMFPRAGWEESDDWGLAVDVAETDDGFTIKASVPGINPDDLEITLTNNILTIKGERSEEKEIEESHYHLRERRHGSFSRSITLPTKVNEEKIEASCENGVLTLNVPKAEEIKPKRITVKLGTGRKTIEG